MTVGDWHQVNEYRFQETLSGPMVQGTCVGCGERALTSYGPDGKAREAGCEACLRARHGASLDYYGTDAGGLGNRIRHAPGGGSRGPVEHVPQGSEESLRHARELHDRKRRATQDKRGATSETETATVETEAVIPLDAMQYADLPDVAKRWWRTARPYERIDRPLRATRRLTCPAGHLVVEVSVLAYPASGLCVRRTWELQVHDGDLPTDDVGSPAAWLFFRAAPGWKATGCAVWGRTGGGSPWGTAVSVADAVATLKAGALVLDDKRFREAVRARMEATGEKYHDARRGVLAEGMQS